MNKITTRIITGLKVTEIEGDRHFIHMMAHTNPRRPIDFNDLDSPSFMELEKELIVARRYSRMSPDGEVETWLIGFDEESCKVLDILPTGEREDYVAVKASLAASRRLNQTFSNQILMANKASIWTRIKWVFTGVKWEEGK